MGFDLEPHLSPTASISSDEDLEGGQPFEPAFTISTFKDDTATSAREELIVPKCVSFNGRRSRRLSSDNLPFQRRFSRRESSLSNNSNNSNEPLPPTYRPHRRSASQRSVTPDLTDPKKASRSSHKLLLILFLSSIAISITYALHNLHVSHLHQKVQDLHAAHKSVEESHGRLTSELQTAAHNMAQYSNMARLKEQLTENLIRRAEVAEGQLKDMQDKIRLEGYHQVRDVHGNGPYIVQMDVQSSFSTTVHTITLELASIDETDGMPHAISVFLNQLSLHIWDEATLSPHDGKLIFIPHHPPSEVKPTAGTDTSRYIPSVLFPEYSPTNPHKEYTIAFSDGELYINVKPVNSGLMDDKFVKGESCFGKVREHDVIDALNGGDAVVRDVRLVKG